MRLTSTGLGIGTSTAYSKLYLKQPGNGSGVAGFVIENSANDNRLAQYFDGSGDEWRITASYGSTGAFKPITFWTSDTKRLTLDTSGNLGLGVTPSVIDLGKNFEIGVAGSGLWSTGSATDIRMMSNVYYNNGYKFAGTGYAAVFLVNAGRFIWQQSSVSGTAGNAVTVVEPMTLDASGNLALGTTSANGRATIVGNTVDIRNSAGAYGSGYATEISTNANIPRYNLVDNGVYTGLFTSTSGVVTFGNASNNAITFDTNNTERARIDSDGNFLFGMTVASGNGFIVYPDGSSTDVPLIDCRGDSASNSLKSYRVFSTSLGQEQFYVSYAGTVFARSTSISALSDQREKQNIRTLETGLTEVLALQPRRFDWKNGQGENVAGFIAQEVQAVLPDLIDEYSLSDTEKRMALKMGDMIPTLVKAIQEQQVIIESLKARLDAANL
jgi:hypothetical protein